MPTPIEQIQHLDQALWQSRHQTRQHPPRLLWHYTVVSGLLGIIKERSIWSSDIRYMNDAGEVSYAFDTIKKVIEGLPPTLRDIYNNNLAHVVSSLNFRVFSTSFCEDGDDLTQWRAYARTSGVSIGVYLGALPTTDIRHVGTLGGQDTVEAVVVKVIYDLELQKELIKDLLLRFGEFYLQNYDELQMKTVLFATLCRALRFQVLDLQLRLKNPRFHAEKEWRIVFVCAPGPAVRSVIIQNRLIEIKTGFRESNGGAVPYIPALLLATRERPLPTEIIAVRQGPRTEPDLYLASLTEAFYSNDLRPHEFFTSAIPTRF